MITIEVVFGLGCIGGVTACVVACYEGAILNFLAYAVYSQGLFNSKFENHTQLAKWVEGQYRFITGKTYADDVLSIEAMFSAY